jgi:CAAX protease family protein
MRGWLPAGQEALLLIFLAVWQGMVVLLTLAASGLLSGRSSLPLGAPRGSRFVYLQAILLLGALNLLVSVVQYFAAPEDMYADLRPFVGMVEGPQWLYVLLVVGVGAPLSEELLFRGYLLPALARTRFGYVGGALISTAIWTALHAGYTFAGIAQVFLIGMFFCWLLWRTGSLRVAIFCHALYNSLIVVFLRYVPLPT